MRLPDAPPTNESEILSAAVRAIEDVVPSAWSVKRVRSTGPEGGLDSVVTISDPHGTRTALYAEVKRIAVTRDLSAMLEQARSRMGSEGRGLSSTGVLLVARYFAPALQQWLSDRDIPYADAAGNLRIALERPALYLRVQGSQKDPWRGPGRPKGNLKGASAARIVRALADFSTPYSVPELMSLAGTPSGNTYRAIEFIEEQGLLNREGGRVVNVRWRQLLERWEKDYSFTMLASEGAYLAPRGVPELMARLANLRNGSLKYAITGSLATPKWEAYAPARSAMLYTNMPGALAEVVGLRRVDSGANVLIADSATTAAFDRTQTLDGAVIVGPSQAAIDLLTSPGRGPEEGRALLDWMERYESVWRR